MRWGKVSLVSGAISCGTTLAQTQNANASDIIPGAYIIEFADNYDVNSFMTTSEASGSEIRRRLDYELFNGVSIQLDEGIDVDAAVGGIANIDQVKNVWPVRKIPMPNVTVHWTGNDQDVAASMLKKRQSTNESDAYSPHFMTQVDRLHAEGVKGKGIKIAVIDSGIDYMHPALGGCFGPGCLVSYGAIYAGDESEPLDCIGHGTHVAGIIAAQQNKFGFIGAAPEVELGNYRIGGCNSFASDDDLIAAANQAYQDGSDIISMSLGWSSGWSDEPVAKALTRIVEAGVPCTVAAGNEGASGLFLPSNPASGDKVAAIASVENSELPEILLEASYTTGNSSSKTFGWRDGFPEGWRNGTFPLWSKSWDLSNPDDSCKPIPEGVDLTDHIALIFWAGNCYLDDKIEDAAAHGARFFLVYVESPVALGIATGVPVEGLGAVQYEQGREWEELLAKNVSITLDIVDIASANRFLTSKPNPRGGFVSTYSTWGPGNRMEQKPQFGAPGSYILSTYPVAQGGYAILSGTSMATPLAAAIYALVGQVRGTLDPATIENVLSGTAKPNLWHDRTGPYPYLAPTAQQGGGLMQAYDAAFSTTILSASSIAFGDTEHAVSEANFTIRNIGTTDKTYLLSNVRAATGLTIDTTTGLAQWFPNDMTTEGAGMAFDSNEITVPAGGEVMVTVVPTPPDLDASRLPVWSGYIALNSTDGDSISLPYLGLVGSLSSIGPLYKDPARGTMIQDGFGGSMEPNRSYTFPKGELNPDYLYPIPSIVLAWASYVVRVEAIALDESLNTEEIGGVKVAGSVFVPLYFRSRANAIGDWFNGELVNGTYVPEGGYKLLFRALRNYGDENKKEDYDFVESPPFFISYVE